jgi:hypothetical protein
MINAIKHISVSSYLDINQLIEFVNYSAISWLFEIWDQLLELKNINLNNMRQILFFLSTADSSIPNAEKK